MSDTDAAVLQTAFLILCLIACYHPLGAYLARVFTTDQDWRVERAVYRVLGVDPRAEQRWPVYARAVLAFSLVGVVLLYALQRLQHVLPWSLGMPGVDPAVAFNTAVSFVTNTNWQSYSGETTMGYLVQMAGLTVQNFVSAAVGIAIAIALVRGFARSRTELIGNFWVDLIRCLFRVLVPIAVIAAIVLIAAGSVESLSAGHVVHTLAGGTQHLPSGPVASQEAIKELGTNGGGFYNANSAQPFENPNPFSNEFEIFLMLLIPITLTRTFGIMVGDPRQGYAIVAVMAALWLVILAATTALELHHPGSTASLAGGSLEGKETRFGVPGSTIFSTTSTGTSTGAVNSFHDSWGGVAGGLLILNMGLGEISPGGVGTGVYGILMMAILAVFVGGLMVGRTPEYLHKKITAREIKLVALYAITMPMLVLAATGLAMSLKSARASMLNPGAHGFSEVLYAFMSASNNNGSAFAGINANTDFYNIATGLCMLAGRFIPILFALALAGSLAIQRPVPQTSGTLPTHGPLFVSLLTGVAVIVAGLNFFPALALGPLADGLS